MEPFESREGTIMVDISCYAGREIIGMADQGRDIWICLTPERILSRSISFLPTHIKQSLTLNEGREDGSCVYFMHQSFDICPKMLFERKRALSAFHFFYKLPFSYYVIALKNTKSYRNESLIFYFTNTTTGDSHNTCALS